VTPVVSQTRVPHDSELRPAAADVLDDPALELDLTAAPGLKEPDPHRSVRQSFDRIGELRSS
jgi:hypothetical protein